MRHQHTPRTIHFILPMTHVFDPLDQRVLQGFQRYGLSIQTVIESTLFTLAHYKTLPYYQPLNEEYSIDLMGFFEEQSQLMIERPQFTLRSNANQRITLDSLEYRMEIALVSAMMHTYLLIDQYLSKTAIELDDVDTDVGLVQMIRNTDPLLRVNHLR